MSALESWPLPCLLAGIVSKTLEPGIRPRWSGALRLREGRSGVVTQGSGAEGFLGALVLPAAVSGIEDALANPQALGRDLEQLVVPQVLDGLIQAHLARRGEPVVDLLEGLAHIGDVALLAHVDDEIPWALMLADHHALVDFDSRAEEERPALLGVLQAVGRGDPRFPCDQRPFAAAERAAGHGQIAVEDAVQESGAARDGHEVVAEAQQATRRNQIAQAHGARRAVRHILHLTL